MVESADRHRLWGAWSGDSLPPRHAGHPPGGATRAARDRLTDIPASSWHGQLPAQERLDDQLDQAPDAKQTVCGAFTEMREMCCPV